MSNILGVGQIAEFKPRIHHVTFSALDHISQIQIITIGAGEKVAMTVELVGA